ncbi:DUF4328 domain-containing protein [Kitasatospora sp. NPDC051853]|uniref:DUF4328 domain-containing protein n=1 Tax=Kitasatospora sp. NPDC051853 TaxID=3364058 RepID=UPI0037A3482B
MNSEQNETAQPSPWQAPSATPAGAAYPAPPVMPAPAGAYRSAKGLGIAAVVMLVLVALTDVLNAAMSLVVRGEYQKQVDGSAGSSDEVVGPEAVAGLTSLLQLAALVASGVVFLCWFWRVRKNAEALAPHFPHRKRRAWAIWGWIVPIVSLWFPLQMTQDVLRAGSPQQAPGRGEGLIGGWWAAWIVSLMLGRIDQKLYLDAETDEAYVTSFTVTPLADLADLVAAVLAILMVRRLTAAQEAAAARAPQQQAYWPQQYPAGPQV